MYDIDHEHDDNDDHDQHDDYYHVVVRRLPRRRATQSGSKNRWQLPGGAPILTTEDGRQQALGYRGGRTRSCNPPVLET